MLTILSPLLTFLGQMKYTLLDERDISLAREHLFEVSVAARLQPRCLQLCLQLGLQLGLIGRHSDSDFANLFICQNVNAPSIHSFSRGDALDPNSNATTRFPACVQN